MPNSDFSIDQTFHQFDDLDTELDHHRIMSGFHGAFATRVASQYRKLILPGTWFRPPYPRIFLCNMWDEKNIWGDTLYVRGEEGVVVADCGSKDRGRSNR